MTSSSTSADIRSYNELLLKTFNRHSIIAEADHDKLLDPNVSIDALCGTLDHEKGWGDLHEISYGGKTLMLGVQLHPTFYHNLDDIIAFETLRVYSRARDSYKSEDLGIPIVKIHHVFVKLEHYYRYNTAVPHFYVLYEKHPWEALSTYKQAPSQVICSVFKLLEDFAVKNEILWSLTPDSLLIHGNEYILGYPPAFHHIDDITWRTVMTAHEQFMHWYSRLPGKEHVSCPRGVDQAHISKDDVYQYLVQRNISISTDRLSQKAGQAGVDYYKTTIAGIQLMLDL
ncbi:MAG: hypothetical protein H0X02_06325 [Nitrosomonas sp.]|nr:hypothetical protein [Nitrosomonas sp.]